MLSEQVRTEGFREITSLVSDMAGREQFNTDDIEGLYLHHPTFEHKSRATVRVIRWEPQLLFCTVCTALVTVRIGENNWLIS